MVDYAFVSVYQSYADLMHDVILQSMSSISSLFY